MGKKKRKTKARRPKRGLRRLFKSKRKEQDMRQRKVIKIDDREITITELTVEEIKEIYDRVITLGDAGTVGDVFSMARETLPKITKDLTVEDLKTMAPSEIEVLIEGFKEVNSAAVKALVWAGLDGLAGDIRAAFSRDLVNLAATSPEEEEAAA